MCIQIRTSNTAPSKMKPREIKYLADKAQNPSYYQHLSKEQLASYDTLLVAFSGGKDSVACFLHLLDMGVPKEKIELWHHDIDGRESEGFMDWPITREYCKAFAKAFGVPIYFSWKVGGFEQEMLRQDTPTAATRFETPEGTIGTAGGNGKGNTRMMFPQVSADLSVRWCSSYLKIGVMSAALNGQERFLNKRTLVLTGERAQESVGRSYYRIFEPHNADNRRNPNKKRQRVFRHVDHYRPVHAWTEQKVWDIMKKYMVNPHVAYRLGWGRVSCACCIFGSANQWASLAKVLPARLAKIAAYEKQFGKTIQRRLSVTEQAEKGTAYATLDEDLVAEAVGEMVRSPIIVEEWVLPAGAFGESNGPL